MLKKRLSTSRLPHNTLEAVLEPLDGLGLGDTVVDTNVGTSTAALGDTLTRTGPENMSVYVKSIVSR